MASTSSEPVIVGAGPVGVAAALFLARAGTRVRLVDRAARPRTHSRALVVNPRTLQLLEPTGVTEQLLAIGKRIVGAQFRNEGRVVAQLSLDQLPGDRKFLLAISQSVTERLLREALEKAGGTIELADCRPADGGAAVELHKTAADGQPEIEHVTAPWLLAADGAHSVARSALEVPFPGSTFARQWYLADAPLQTDLPEDHVHIIFLPGGRFLFLARVIDDQQPPTAAPLWRVLGNLRDPATRVPNAMVAGPLLWTSAFTIEHRIVAAMQRGPIALAGDAAHVHSPVGARGMNLGIEDAWVFARLTLAGRQADYGKLRRKVDRSVVRRVSAIARMAGGESITTRLLRRWALPAVIKVPAVRRNMLATVSGLDHPLPAV
jgi:2-polyprenyl-6-methoxyphenol hydroxylase-like FAD-dependent oxidoreductase